MPRAIVAGVVVSAALLGVVVTRALLSSTPEIVATIDGAVITRADFDNYAGVFAGPDGELTITRQQVLTSLLNQAIVAQEAAKLNIAITETQIADAIRAWEDLGVPSASLDRSGGVAALRDRFRMFLLFREVQRAVIPDPAVSEWEVLDAYRRDMGALAVRFDDVRIALRERLVADKARLVWEDWLARKRACSNIVVIDASLSVQSHAPERPCDGADD